MKCRKDIIGHKIWANDDPETRPPSVEISLLRNGEVYKTTTLDSTGDGVFTFPCVPVRKDSSEKSFMPLSTL